MTRRLVLGLVLLLVVIAAVGAALAVRGANAGPIIAVVRLTQMPSDVAVDPRTHRAFVITFDGAQRTSPFNGRLRVLDTASGQLIESVKTGLDLQGGALALDAAEGHVFVIGNQGASKVLTLDANSGALRNTAVVSPFAQLTALDKRSHRLFVVNSAGPGSTTALNVLDTASGALLTQSPVLRTSDPLDLDVQPSALTVDERAGRVFVVALTRNLAATGGAGPGLADVLSIVDARSGRLLRTVPLGSAPSSIFPSPAALAVDERRGRLLVLDPNVSSLIALDTRSGAVLYRMPLAGGNGGATPLWALDQRDGLLYLSSSGALRLGGRSGGVSVLDVRSGRLLRTVLTGAHPGAPFVDEQTRRVFVPMLGADGPGHAAGVAVLDAPSGRLLSMTNVAAPDVLSGDEQRHRIYVLNGGNQISVLDARNGRLIRAITLGGQPGEVAVDEANGRLVVPTIGPVTAPDRWSWVPGWLRRRLPFLPAPPGPAAGTAGSIVVLDPTR